MQRKQALIASGFLTAVVMGTALTLTGFAGGAPVTATKVQTAAPHKANVQTLAAIQPRIQAAQIDLAKQSTELNARIEQGKAMLAELDAKAQPQLASLKDQLSAMELDAANRLQRMQSLQREIEATQSEIQQDVQDFQNRVAEIQTADASAREQVEAAAGQLQAAYDELAQRQATASAATNNDNSDASSGGQDSGGHANDGQEHEHENGHEHEHENEDHGGND